MSTGVQSMDALGLIDAIRSMHGGTGPTAGEWKKIGEGRQYSRLSAVFNPKTDGAVDPYNLSMGRLFGDDWREKKARGELTPAYIGNAIRQAQEHARKLEGAITIMSNAFNNLNASLYDAGVYDDIASGMRSVAAAVTAVSKMDPSTLRGVATGLMALAAVGPSLWIGGRLIALAAGITRFGAAVTGLSTTVAAANAAPAVAKAAAATAATRGLPAGAAATGALGMGAVGTAAGLASGLVLNELLNGLHYAGAIETNMWRKGKGPGHFEYSGEGRTRTRRWVPDSRFERYDQEHPQSTSLIGAAWDYFNKVDPWARRPKNLPGSMWGHTASAAELSALGGVPGGMSIPGSSAFKGLTPIGGSNFQKVQPIQVYGQAQVDINNRVTVEPSPNFITKVMDAVTAKVKVNLGQTMAGSNAPAHINDVMNGAAMP